jgi:S-adenosylmethionine:tRNA ribosyltransferase-isomerase
VSSELDQFDYTLPRHLIAQEPLAQRADARLLVVDRASRTLTHAHVRDLPEILRPGDALVMNDTRVVPARLVGHRQLTGGRWEGLFLSADSDGTWRVLAKSRGRLTPGETVILIDTQARDDIRLRLVEKQPGGVWTARPETDQPALEVLERVGRVPLPPYIRHGEMIDADRRNYQTVFARHPGAVAAPTAGLHFTTELLRRLEQSGILVRHVTLHIGLDTFRPIAAARLEDHPMHSEWGIISPSVVADLCQCRVAGGRIVAVGSTSVRVLESAAADGQLKPWSGETRLFIRPPYQFKAVDALMTNFHLPRTTLLVLVTTFGGRELILHAYQEAIREQYRFYSYGDAMLVL